MIETKKKIMLEELNHKISTWDDYSEVMYGYSKKEAQDFLKRFQVGIYDNILKESFWFTSPINIDTLVNWEKDRKKYSILTNISEENFIVYSILIFIKEYISKINNYPKVYNSNYHTKINNYIQLPLTESNTKILQKSFIKILNKNYSWREVQEIVTNFKQLNISENKDFPNNITVIQNIFTPQIKTYYQDHFKKELHFQDIAPIDHKIKILLTDLTKEKINEFITNKKTSQTDKYIINTLKNMDIKKPTKISKLFHSLITPKKVNNLTILLNNLNSLDSANIQKYYEFIYKNTTELEYIEETAKILNKLINLLPKSKETKFNLILIFNTILSSRKIVPPILTEEIINLKEEERIKKIIIETTSLAKSKEA